MEQKYTLKDKIKAMGPGILVVGSFIGPGTVTSATSAGAGYGYALIFLVDDRYIRICPLIFPQ